MIEIKITDPQLEPARVLRAIALALNSIAADKEGPGPAVENTVTVAATGDLSLAQVFDAIKAEKAAAINAEKAAKLTLGDPVDLPLTAAGQFAPGNTGSYSGRETIPVAPGGMAPELGMGFDPATVIHDDIYAAGAAEVPEPPKPTLAEDAPPPAPALATDAPPPAAPSSDVAQVVLDKAGLPWDDRIHSSSKALNQTDGLWRARRGVADDVVTRVTAELRELMAIPAADAPPAPPAPSAPADAPPAPPAPTGVPSGFIELMPLVTAAVSAKRITAEEFAEAWKATGVPALTDLMARPDLAQAVYYALADRL